MSDAERLRRMEEQLFRQQVAVLNALPAHIALLDTSGTIVWVNEAWLRFERAEAQGACLGVGLNYLQVCDVATGDYSEEAGSVGSGIRSVIRGEIPAFGLEYPCHSPTERRWFRLMVTPLDAVRPGGVVVMHTNVTERRLAEERLREALARSAEAERIAQLGSWELSLLDLEHLSNNPITVSDELLRIAGVEPGTERPTAADLVRLLPTEAQDELRAALRTALRERRPYSLVHRILWADGTERVVHQRGRCFFDEATDQPLKLVGTARDITEQTRTDEAVRQSEREQRLLAQQLEGERARLAAAQRVAKVGSWETDLATLEVTWSDEIHRIFETEPATFRPTHPRFLERIHPEDRAAVEQAFLDSSNVHEPCSIEHRILLPGGGTKTVEERWQTIFEEGRAVRAIGTCHDITDRKRADEALRSSRDLLRIASNAARLGGWMLELPSQNFSFSEELIAIHELPENADPSQEELIALYDPGPREVLRRHLDACLRDGTPYDVELPKRTASGRQIWLRSIGEAVRDADGRIVRLQGAGQDITSRKLAEQELARMNRALRLLSSCTDAVVRAQSEQALLDQVCRIAVEEGGYRLACVGYAEQDPAKTLRIHASAGVGTGYLDGLSLSWSSEVAAGNGPAGRAIRTGELVASRDVAADAGFAVWRDRALAHGIRSVLCFPLREAASTFGVLCLYAAEVSEAGADELELLEELAEELAFGIVHLRAREEHRRSEQTVREQAALLEQTSEAIFVRDLEDRITYWNRGAERLYGWSSDEVVGRRAAELFHRNDATRLAQARSAQEHGLATGAWVGELHKLDKAGGTRLIAARWSLLRDATGQPRAILTIDADITEKRRIETQLLRNQRLESIGTLAGGIAHDLNNVLTPILVSLSMLSEEETDPSKREDLAVLETAARRGAAMVGQLLSFARGEPQGPHKRVEVGAIAGEVLKMVRETFPKDISAVFQKGESPWAIQGDATQIHQLLTNLCVNARDAMPNGGVLTVALEGVVVDDLYAGMSAETPSGRYLRLRVEDTGSGMAPEVRDRIFEPFFTTKPSGSGTGLGLSTCHAIARNHGGFILVTSERGKGSRFDVYLPADVSSQAPAEAASARADLLLGRGELVLVVDDEEAIRKVTRRTLERYGYRVLLAAHGADAVALYAANAGAIAAVLTDMSMPIMDGPTTIVALQAIDPSVRIIGSTGLDSDGKAAKARALGVTHWVPKPYTAELLLQMLRAVIG